ncbi:MAG: hypothetical protein GY750_03720 [Lentisphaerae bacterium]|nr:hypothetical protein [Lentisphaerota bacterium]MCP4100523.1 hypothetical protein [Lentisphaerota bacterium]
MRKVLVLQYDKYGHPDNWLKVFGEDTMLTVIKWEEYSRKPSISCTGKVEMFNSEAKANTLFKNWMKTLVQRHDNRSVYETRTYEYGRSNLQSDTWRNISYICAYNDILIIEPTAKNLPMDLFPNSALRNKPGKELKYPPRKNFKFHSSYDLMERLEIILFPYIIEEFGKSEKPIFGTCFGHHLLCLREGIPVRRIITVKEAKNDIKLPSALSGDLMVRFRTPECKQKYKDGLGRLYDYEHGLVAYIPTNKHHGMNFQCRRMMQGKELPWIKVREDLFVKPHHMYQYDPVVLKKILRKRYDYWEKNIAISEAWSPRVHCWQHHPHMVDDEFSLKFAKSGLNGAHGSELDDSMGMADFSMDGNLTSQTKFRNHRKASTDLLELNNKIPVKFF